MAIAFAEGQVKDSGVSPATTAAFTASIGTGQLLVVYAGSDIDTLGQITGVTDSKGNTWHQVPGMNIIRAGSVIALDAWYCVPTTGGTGFTVSVAFNDASANCNIVVQYFNGFTGTPTLDQVKSQSNASSTTCTSGTSAATTQAVEVIIGGGIHATTTSAFSLGAGYTNLTQSSVANRQVAMESKVVAATGTQVATFTIAAARANLGGVATFYDAVVTPPSASFSPLMMMGVS